MIKKKLLCQSRRRKIMGSFAFIPHRFLLDGFFADLKHHELLLYFFLITAADRNGLSYYSYDKICTLLRISVEEYIQARNGLIAKDLLSFDGYLFQLLSLPDEPVDISPKQLKTQKEMESEDPATISLLCSRFLSIEKGI